MTVTIREAEPADAEACGRICYEAFAAIAAAHNFPPDVPSLQAAIGLMTSVIANPATYGVVAERNGQIAGSNFLYEVDMINGVGPITIDPHAQNSGIGSSLMHAVMHRARQRGAPGVRLVQAGYHCRSLSLYAKLGFDVREPLVCIQGPALAREAPGYQVRPVAETDLPACNDLALRIHGHDRAGELNTATRRGTASLVERAGRITGYTTQIGFFGHAMAATNDDLFALIAAAAAFAGPGFILPCRNTALLRWCLSNGLRVTQPMTLMTTGLYTTPTATWLPSILY
jgi:predicted N-acetyltransferase YhbS